MNSFDIINLDTEWNGIYKKTTNISDGQFIYKKDDQHFLYRWQGVWRLGIYGVKVVYLNSNKGDSISLNGWYKKTFNSSNSYPTIIINNQPIIDNVESKTIIKYKFTFNKKEYEIINKFYDNINNIYNGIEGVICLFIPFAIMTGTKIKSNIPICKKFYDNMYKLVDIYKNLTNKENLFLDLDIPTHDNIYLPNNKNLATFTLGVDSFYTLLTNLDKIDTLLFVIGFDLKLTQKELLSTTINNIKEVCQLYNKNLVICESNLKNIFPIHEFFKWGEYLHAPALFNIAYGLCNNYSTLYIPSSFVVDKEFVWGSTFATDKLYSSNQLKIITDGVVKRTKKTEYIITTDVRVLDYLRVCWRNSDNKYNCSKCSKCIRTMIPIKLLDYGKYAKTFDMKNLNENILSTLATLKDHPAFMEDINSFIKNFNKK